MVLGRGGGGSGVEEGKEGDRGLGQLSSGSKRMMARRRALFTRTLYPNPSEVHTSVSCPRVGRVDRPVWEVDTLNTPGNTRIFRDPRRCTCRKRPRVPPLGLCSPGRVSTPVTHSSGVPPSTPVTRPGGDGSEERLVPSSPTKQTTSDWFSLRIRTRSKGPRVLWSVRLLSSPVTGNGRRRCLRG